MIRGIGIDSVDISRFSDWASWPEEQLLAIFTPSEITYCLQTPTKSAERFAARFAAKEAFYKALCTTVPTFTLSLRACLPYIEVVNSATNGHVGIAVNWQALDIGQEVRKVQIHLSITHTATVATAITIIST